MRMGIFPSWRFRRQNLTAKRSKHSYKHMGSRQLPAEAHHVPELKKKQKNTMLNNQPPMFVVGDPRKNLGKSNPMHENSTVCVPRIRNGLPDRDTP